MIQITYIDGSIDEFKSSSYIFTDFEESDDWVNIKENPKNTDDDEYNDDDDKTIAEIQRNQIRKIQYE
jgi:hypothetical protein